MKIATVPAELRERPHWVVWRFEERDGKETKVPYRCDNGGRASTTDPATWSTFETAVEVATIADGIGYVFSTQDPYVGIDLDAFGPTEIAIVSALDSYTERSVSGRGAHVIVRAEFTGSRNRSGPLEIYAAGRYFAMTGDHVRGTPTTIEERQAQLERVVAEFLPPAAPAPPVITSVGAIDLDDRELLERAFAAKNGDRLRMLYGGDWQSRYDSQSEAELALCRTAAFWTGRDPIRIDAWLRSSGLYRQKWERADYRERTIAAAIAATSDVYTPRVTPQGVATPSSGAARRARLTKIGDVTPKRVEWLEENLIARGMLTGLVAPGGTVKGLYGIHQAAKLARRDEKTLFVCSEDALDYIVRPRFLAAGCDAELAFALSIDDTAGEQVVPHFPSDLPLLQAAISEIEPQLVIIDPIASYIDAGLDMSKNNEMRLILQPLITLASSAYVAILVVYHHGKNRDRGALGTVAFEDACRLVLTAARDDDDEDVRHIELTKSNISPTGYGRKFRIVGVPTEIEGEIVEVAKLVDEGRSGKSVHTLLARKGAPGPEPEKRERARAALIDVLIDANTKGVNSEEAKHLVAKEADVSKTTVWRAFDELKGDRLAVGEAIRDEFGSILEWRWVAKATLLLGRNDA